MLNPLLPDLLSLLRKHPQGLSEHAILTELSDHALFAGQDRHDPLSLFRQHFLVMNGLYQLQQQLWQQEECYLSISPLLIQLGPRRDLHSQELDHGDATRLRDYYLDWRNYDNTTVDDVCDLLASFWQRMGNGEGRQAALDTLQLENSASAEQVTRRYRELAARHHPDRGGDPERFIQIRQAYELLMSTH